MISRSGDICAYPGCDAELTISARGVGDRPKAVGKVSHIAAASPGGPRYDPSMTPEQRGSADNLIYLCGPHHDVIDSQLEYHTSAFLLRAKQKHESAARRASRKLLGKVTFVELEVVCTVISQGPRPLEGLGVTLALPIQQKIDLNGLGVQTVERITDGLAQARRVEDFLSFQTTQQPGFARALVARFRSHYYAALAEGLTPDEVFDYIVEQAAEDAGPRDTPAVRAAALAVIAYLFEICEIFYRE